MAGRKHHMWNTFMSGQGKDLNNIQDPFDRHAAFVGQMQQPFCKLCGKMIDIGPREEENKRDWRYEMEVEMHTECMQEERERRSTAAIVKAKEEAEKAKEPKKSLEDIIMEQYGLEVNNPSGDN